MGRSLRILGVVGHVIQLRRPITTVRMQQFSRNKVALWTLMRGQSHQRCGLNHNIATTESANRSFHYIFGLAPARSLNVSWKCASGGGETQIGSRYGGW